MDELIEYKNTPKYHYPLWFHVLHNSFQTFYVSFTILHSKKKSTYM